MGTLLELRGSVTVPALCEFDVRIHFKADTIVKAPAKIRYVGNSFRAGRLIDKIEPAKSNESVLCYHDLLQSSVDNQIVAELGGEEKVETTLAEIWSLMARQSQGDGVLRIGGTYGYIANVFYVRDADGKLRTVRVRWWEGWDVNDSEFGRPCGWKSRDRVFSRNP